MEKNPQENLSNLEVIIIAIERWGVISILSFMVVASFLQVALRTVFSTGILWADTLLRHLVLWLAFLGAGLAASSGRQFAIDAAHRVLKGTPRNITGLIVSFFTAYVCVMLTGASWAFLREEIAHPAVLFTAAGFDIQAWWLQAILPGGFGLLAAHYSILAVRSALELCGFPFEGEPAE